MRGQSETENSQEENKEKNVLMHFKGMRDLIVCLLA